MFAWIAKRTGVQLPSPPQCLFSATYAAISAAIGTSVGTYPQKSILKGLPLPHAFGRLWYGKPNAISNAIDYAKHRSRSHKAAIRVYDEAGNVIETHEHAGEFKEL